MVILMALYGNGQCLPERRTHSSGLLKDALAMKKRLVLDMGYSCDITCGIVVNTF